MIAGLQQQFEAERTIKSATERLKFPLSVQWITQKTDENFVKVWFMKIERYLLYKMVFLKDGSHCLKFPKLSQICDFEPFGLIWKL